MSQEIRLTLDESLQLALMDFFENPAPESAIKLAKFGRSNVNNFQYLLAWQEEYDIRTRKFPFPLIDKLTDSGKLGESIRSLHNTLFTPNFSPTQTDIENIHALPGRLEEIVDYLDRYLALLKQVEKEHHEAVQSTLVRSFETAVGKSYASFSAYISKDRDEIYPAIVADGRKFIEKLRQVLSSEQALSVIPAIGNDRSP